MDFTLKVYKKLLNSLKKQNYSFYTLEDFIKLLNSSTPQLFNFPLIILRHDVDRLPKNALEMANIEKELGVRASYYFRVVKQSFDADIIKEIAGLGHEIGYHYENLAKAGQRLEARGKRQDGISSTSNNSSPHPLPLTSHHIELAIEDFKQNLERLRKLCPVKTICMHGSPLSKIDNRDLWKVYDYRDYGIIAEPYFDVDFNKVLYLTDTGRRWDGERVSIRDKVSWSEARGQGSGEELSSISKPLTANHSPNSLHSTFDIIRAAEQGLLPEKIMINIHPQRWTNKPFTWVKELVWQNVKNVIKRFYT